MSRSYPIDADMWGPHSANNLNGPGAGETRDNGHDVVVRLRQERDQAVAAYRQSDESYRAATSENKRLNKRVTDLELELDGMKAREEYLKKALASKIEDCQSLYEQVENLKASQAQSVPYYKGTLAGVSSSAIGSSEVREKTEVSAILHKQLSRVAEENKPAEVSPGSSQPTPQSSDLTFVPSSIESFDAGPAIEKWMESIKDWCYKYGCDPHPKDRHMNIELRSYMNTACQSSAVNSFLANKDMRPMLMARYIIEQATNTVFKIGIVKDFNRLSEPHEAVTAARDSLRNSLTSHQRAAVYVMQKDAVTDMRRHPEFGPYLRYMAAESSQKMFKIVSFFLPPGTDAAYMDLRWLWEVAYELGSKLLCTTSVYRFDYIRPTNNSYFNPDAMVSIDKRYQGTPQSLRKSDMRVSLCVTPVMVKTEQVSDTIAPKMLFKAQVMLTE